ncbi:hypothetical protein ACHHYP_20553 [Achlya hypogyna]|uniref:Transmembrane protein n=1 Tax=Achlya hypogyna TaxID=1202772 RepID=A0A1V9YJ49_ACHHY|nr:hypothetical protein ACHHYP_20553 [Achlya hypogyna]
MGNQITMCFGLQPPTLDDTKQRNEKLLHLPIARQLTLVLRAVTFAFTPGPLLLSGVFMF